MSISSPILACLPLLADVLGRSTGVIVEIGGSSAFTDGRTIRLPNLPASGDPDFLGLVRGYIDHEAAHIRHTDTAAMVREAPTPLEKHVWNTFEDWRIERELARTFPGCAANFRWLIRRLFLNQASQPTLYAVLDWLLYTVRSWAVPELADDRDFLAARVETLWPGLTARILPILERMRAHCPDTLAALAFAREVVRILRDAAASQTPRGRKGTKAANQADAAPDCDRKAQVRRASGAQAGKRKPKKSSKAGEQSPVSVIADSTDLGDLIGAGENQLPEDGSTVLRHALEMEAKALGASCAVARVVPKPFIPVDPQIRKDARQAAAGLEARLHGLLQASRLQRSAPSRRGALDPHRLFGVAVGDPRLFLSHRPRPGIDTAVHILLDASGSMHSRITLAGACALAGLRALDRVGCSVGLTAFPGLPQPDHTPTVSPILAHGRRMRDLDLVDTGGSTPLGEALWWMLQRLVPLRESRKLVVVITDGQPDEPEAAKIAIRMAESLGIEVYGLGILSDSLKDLLPRTSRTVETLDQLPGALLSLLKDAMRHRRA